ncbi:MAG: diguanylate cyclase [Candidatus Hydrogenedentota bacterium]|nr:MAG: diguanylate cyclase [Candidatus Hydrogenedentota bacterium]
MNSPEGKGKRGHEPLLFRPRRRRREKSAMSLRKKLMGLVALLVLGVLTATVAVVQQQLSNLVEEHLEDRLEAMSSSISVLLLPALVYTGGHIEKERAEIEAVLKRMVEKQKDIVLIELFDRHMKRLVTYPREQGGRRGDLAKTYPMRLKHSGRIYGYERVTFDLSKYRQIQRKLLLEMVLVALLIGSLGAGLTFLLARSITAPLEHLSQVVAAFGEQRFEVRAPVETRDEVGRIAETFNRMADRIQRQVNRLNKLQELGQEIVGDLEQEKVLGNAVKAFAEIAGISKMSVMLLEESTGMLEIKKGLGLTQGTENIVRLRKGEGVAGRVLETGKPIKIERLAESSEYRSYSGQKKDESLLALPLIAKGRCFGVVNLHAKSDGTAFDAGDEAVLSTLTEILAVALENAHLYDMAITDGLTRLYIRRYFLQRLGDEIARARRSGTPLSLMMLDLDHFKNINDTYGHQTGDAVLVGLARVMRRSFREVDILCRYGGEEFTVIMPHTEKEGAMIASERFRKAVEDFEFAGADVPLRLTVSCGVTTYQPGRIVSELIYESDTALYAAKREGRNRVKHFDDLT